MFNFDPEELEGIAPHSVQEQYFQKFSFTLPPLPEGYANIAAPYQETPTASRITPPPSPTRAASVTLAQQTGFGPGVNGINGGGEVINKLVAKRGKRTKSGFASTPSASIPSAFVNQSISAAPPTKGTAASTATRTFDAGPSRTSHQSAPPGAHRQSPNSIPPPADNWPHTLYDADVNMDMEVPIDSLSTISPAAKGKRKGSGFEDDSRPAKARTLGGDRQRETVVVRELGSGGGGQPSSVWSGPHIGNVLPTPSLMSALTVKVEGSEDTLEAKNSDGDGACIFSNVCPRHSNASRRSYRSCLDQWQANAVARLLTLTSPCDDRNCVLFCRGAGGRICSGVFAKWTKVL